MGLRDGYGGRKFSRPAFVLNTRAIGLGVSRSLAMKGVPVIAVDFRKEASKMTSKSFSSYRQIPDVDSDPDSAADALLEIQAECGEKGVLFPTSDAFVLFVSRYRKKLGAQFDTAIPSEEVIEGIMNKRTQYENAVRLGVPIPETRFPTSLSDLDSFKDDMEYPVLIKPYYSHRWQQVFDNKGFQAFNPTELVRYFGRVLDSDVKTEAMVQSVVPGPNTSLRNVRAYIDKGGEVHGAVECQKVRQYPVDFGVGCLNQTMHHPGIREVGIRFMKGIGYRGLGAVEFKMDPSDGVPKMMELNARVGKTIGLSTKAGVNLPWLMYQDMTGMPLDHDAHYADGVRWHDFVMDCRAYSVLRSRSEVTFNEWVRTSLGAECHPYFDWRDLRPSLVSTRYGLTPVNELFHIAVLGVGRTIRDFVWRGRVG